MNNQVPVEPTPKEAEFYETPSWCVHRILEALDLPSGNKWLDSCVGTGAIVNAVSAWFPNRVINWTTADIRHTGFEDYHGDYINPTFKDTNHPIYEKFDVCIMNPPFSRALNFAETALSHCNCVIMLQRLNWLASERRRAWLAANTPSVYVLPNRPSFTGDGKTDGQDYAWFVWPTKHSSVQILETTPKHIRCAR